MERIRSIIETGSIFAIMAVFSVMKEALSKEGAINWKKSFMKGFVNFVAGVSFYSVLISYKPQIDNYPQRIGAIMFVTYIGSKLLDILVDRTYDFFKKENLKSFINKL